MISITQGLMITAGVLGLYYFFMRQGQGLEEVRTSVFTTLLFSNIFLTFANRSFSETIFTTIRYRNNLAPWIVAISLLFIGGIHIVEPVRNIFGMVPIPFTRMLLCSGIAFLSVIWFEVYKAKLSGPVHATLHPRL